MSLNSPFTMSWIEGHPSKYGLYDLTRLGVDEGIVRFKLNSTVPLWIYELNTDCLKCPFQVLLSPSAAGTLDYVQTIRTAFPLKYRFRTSGNLTYVPVENDPDAFCDIEYRFGEFGIYEISAARDTESPQCGVNVILEPVNIYLPILLVALFLVFLEVMVWCTRHYQRIIPETICGRRIWYRGPPVLVDETERSGRIACVDAFKGVCIVLMMFVHDGAASYALLNHATWDGLQLADLAFPWFLWIMGVCIPLSLKSHYKKSTKLMSITKEILLRSLKLLVLGLMLGTIGSPATNMRNFRFFGFLQRFAITYLVCSFVALLCLYGRLYVALKDFMILWKGWVMAILLPVLNLLLTFLLPVPGCPTGYLGPGGFHDNVKYPVTCVGGAAGYIDRTIWGSSHLLQSPTVNEVYNSGDGVPYDPEGTLGFLTAIFQVWTGVQFGATILEFPDWMSILPRWCFWTVFQGLLAGVLCGWGQTGGTIPVNKNLWSLSFVLATNCFGMLLLGFLYVLIDLVKWWSGTPLAESGRNAIFIYIAHLLVQQMLPWHWSVTNMNTHFVLLVESLWGISLWVLIAIWLHRKEIYFSKFFKKWI